VALDALRRNGKFVLSRHNFVGYGAAIHRRDRSVWRTWTDTVYEIDIAQSGARQHVTKMCRACRKGLGYHEALHDLVFVPPKQEEGSPHRLPWLEEPDDDALRERIRHEIEAHELNDQFI
jgi:hypothetical protein